jgi:hypothetical protein
MMQMEKFLHGVVAVCAVGVMLYKTTLLGAEELNEYHTRQHIQIWPLQSATIAETRAIEPNGHGKGQLPQLFINYSYQGLAYSHIEMDSDLPVLTLPYMLNQAQDVVKKLYPEGAQIQIVVNPQSPTDARSASYRSKPLDTFELVFFWIQVAVLLWLVWLLAGRLRRGEPLLTGNPKPEPDPKGD